MSGLHCQTIEKKLCLTNVVSELQRVQRLIARLKPIVDSNSPEKNVSEEMQEIYSDDWQKSFRCPLRTIQTVTILEMKLMFAWGFMH